VAVAVVVVSVCVCVESAMYSFAVHNSVTGNILTYAFRIGVGHFPHGIVIVIASQHVAIHRYVRLRRTPAPAVAKAFDQASTECKSHPVHNLVTIRDPRGISSERATRSETSGISFVAMGTVAVGLALECQASWASGSTVTVVSALGGEVSHTRQVDAWRRVLCGDESGHVHTVITIEDDAGALNSFVAQRIVDACSRPCCPPFGAVPPSTPASKGCVPPLLLFQRVTGVGPSFRSLPACLEHFGFTASHIKRLYDERPTEA
jgi:hypothetical protein